MTKRLSAVVRSILENLRTLGVWVAELAMFRASAGAAGEPWTPWSWLEAAGFALLFVATLAYKGLVRLPWPSLYEGALPRAAAPSPYMASVRR